MPSLVVVGNFITAPKGYPIQPWGGRAIEVSGENAARQAVEKMLDDGADLIKIPVKSGGSWQMVIPVLTEAEIAAIVKDHPRTQYAGLCACSLDR